MSERKNAGKRHFGARNREIGSLKTLWPAMGRLKQLFVVLPKSEIVLEEKGGGLSQYLLAREKERQDSFLGGKVKLQRLTRGGEAGEMNTNAIGGRMGIFVSKGKKEACKLIVEEKRKRRRKRKKGVFWVPKGKRHFAINSRADGERG